jgi:thiosulfate reductase cytochrome b subunit
LSEHLRWQRWRDDELKRETAPERWFTATGWNALHPTQLAFVGVAAVALVGALVTGIVLWITRSPAWYVITGFGLGWVAGALATARLHRTFAGARDKDDQPAKA